MIKLKIAAVGSSPLIAEEILHAAKCIIGADIDITIYSTDEIPKNIYADLYICAITQLKPLQKVIPREKIILLDLMPPAKFFIAVARIPEGETIYIFNNQLEYTRILSDYCQKLGISGVKFLPIAYEEMAQEEIITRLRKARYIIGVDKFIDTILKSTRYAGYLRSDVQIIPATRVASVHSACALIQCIATQFHANITDQAALLTEKLQHTPAADRAALASLHNEAIALRQTSNEAVSAVQNAVVKSVVNHISPDARSHTAQEPTEKYASADKQYTIIRLIHDALHSITNLKATLSLIAEKLAALK